VINSDLGPFSYRFRDTTSYNLKLLIKNCDQTAADRDMVTIESLQEVASKHPVSRYNR